MNVDGKDLIYCNNCHNQIKSKPGAEQITNYKLESNGVLELEWIQHELDLKLHFIKNEIKLIDIPSNELLERFSVDHNIESIDLLTYPDITYHINYSDQSCQNLTIEEFNLASELKTESKYILKIDMQTINRGYYFGLYEIGEFEVINSKIILLRSHKLHYVDRGWIIRNDIFILSIRVDESAEKTKYFMSAFTWDMNKNLKKIWEIKTFSSLRSLIQLKDDLFIFGYFNGNFEIFSKKQRKKLKSIKLFSASFLYMCLKKDKVYCSSLKGELACLSMNGDIIWKTTIGDSRINNIEIKNNQLHVISGERKYHILDASTGSIINRKQFTFTSPQSFSSNFIFFKDWIIVSGQAHLAHIHKSDKKFIISADDPLIRVLQSHSEGYITGDDEGNIKYWKYRKIRLSKRNK